jgi:P27 family predicted phage terminase small subunit
MTTLRAVPETEATPPAHLSKEAAAWWAVIVHDYVLVDHHVKILTTATEAWDRCQSARELVEADGVCVTDRFGALKAHPAIAIERDSRVAFLRALRELALDDAPEDPRPPRHGGRRL